jgi:hypothetical protein
MVEPDLNDELNSSVELLTQDKMKEGLSPPEVRRQALIELGGTEQVKEEARAIRVGRFIDNFARDPRFAVRQLRRNTGFTMTIIVTSAFALARTRAIFSVVNALMLTSLTYPHPERLDTVYTRITGSKVPDERRHLNGEQWELLRDNAPSSNYKPWGRQLVKGLVCLTELSA